MAKCKKKQLSGRSVWERSVDKLARRTQRERGCAVAPAISHALTQATAGKNERGLWCHSEGAVRQMSVAYQQAQMGKCKMAEKTFRKAMRKCTPSYDAQQRVMDERMRMKRYLVSDDDVSLREQARRRSPYRTRYPSSYGPFLP